jgi:hypothetical protein
LCTLPLLRDAELGDADDGNSKEDEHIDCATVVPQPCLTLPLPVVEGWVDDIAVGVGMQTMVAHDVRISSVQP